MGADVDHVFLILFFDTILLTDMGQCVYPVHDITVVTLGLSVLEMCALSEARPLTAACEDTCQDKHKILVDSENII